MGHLASMCRASAVSALIDSTSVPAIGQEIFRLIERGCVPGGTKDNLKLTGATVDWGRTKQELRDLVVRRADERRPVAFGGREKFHARRSRR